ncbi:unnamed protein product [Gordionus sp. m RMFG-2023]|uniref:uncharacterized protein LOC135929452 n=1 Tax=Gordionus sp. m RMFG-2023 TaxID=3053472 RepID=UPI0030DE04CB
MFKEAQNLIEAPSRKIRITLVSKDVKKIEKACKELIERAKSKGVFTRGPCRIPTKRLRITTRKTPCGEGSKTWDRFQLRIYKRVIDLYSPAEIVNQITSVQIDPGVDISATLEDNA